MRIIQQNLLNVKRKIAFSGQRLAGRDARYKTVDILDIKWFCGKGWVVIEGVWSFEFLVFSFEFLVFSFVLVGEIKLRKGTENFNSVQRRDKL